MLQDNYDGYNADAAEEAMFKLYGQFGRIWDYPTGSSLIKTAKAVNPKRLIEAAQGAEAAVQAGTQAYSLYEMGGQQVADKLLGLDVVIVHTEYPDDSDPREVVVGIDVTVNPEEIGRKLKKLNGLKGLINASGIDKVLVCYWALTTPMAELSNKDKRKLVAQLGYAMDNTEWSATVTLSNPS
jgi:hypothetical protein